MTNEPRDIGVLVVHGIGQEKRFEHVEDRVRRLAQALQNQALAEGRTASVEVIEAGDSTLYASQQTWRAGRQSTLRLHLSAANPTAATSAPAAQLSATKNSELADHAGALTISFYEVWWADINDAPGVKRDFSFWLWALSIWLIPRKDTSARAGYVASLRAPVFPKAQGDRVARLWVRLCLFAVSSISVLTTTSLGLLVNLLSRVFDISLGSFHPIATFIAYIDCIKIYSEEERVGGDPLDGLGEPPRYAIRRRMVKSMIDVALGDHDAWYILAHSMGSVIAYNGLMEPEATLANYLDPARFAAASAAFGVSNGLVLDDPMPRRPSWVPPGTRLSRAKLLDRFGGLLTYGSPLDKFAAIWPAKVPINIDTAPLKEKPWFNVFDPTDPVGNALVAFGSEHADDFAPQNMAYRALPVFLESHMWYFSDPAPNALAAGVLRWFAGLPAPQGLVADNAPRRIAIGSFAERSRSLFGWTQALAVVGLLWLFSVATTTLFLELFSQVLARPIIDQWADGLNALDQMAGSPLRRFIALDSGSLHAFLANARIVFFVSLPSIPLVVLLGGLVGRFWHRQENQ